MKKIFYLLISTVFMFTSCNNDEEIIDLSTQNKSALEKGTTKVDICHYDEDTGEWHTINVSENALEAHLAHGDIIGDCSGTLVCHWEPTENTWQSMYIDDEEVDEHMSHGDFLGNCNDNPIDEEYTYIPDNNFEEALFVKGYVTDPIVNTRVLTSEISGITNLNVSGAEIIDLTGIQDFIILKTLNCFNNYELEVLDVSNNKYLKNLNCGNNNITALDLSFNTLLLNLNCSNNRLNYLNLKNVTLKNLSAGNNELNCILVDDEDYYNNSEDFNGNVDNGTSFLSNCGVDN